ncbi:MAG: UDP-N-acetylglucosamine 2-epimerase (non-hydrolyzing) [Clostridium sp.]|jgi:UDP-N-acetylglucosamine 2-epimerase (non-hydrolysing)|nr:UDP-N-acetylglucosamine 2-epimerase (non-hydrolyzing) [Clostridium sp.]MDU7363108.1 UDP-N-acetylglucosamine 2-epimerase (non-hydrolyzing) [Clostridium sp.]
MEIKVMSVFGTRPEAIKMCPLVKALENDPEIESIVCVTGQHREMLDEVLDIFEVRAQYDLNIMQHGQTIIDISNKVLSGVDNVIKKCKPDIVLVHGDTSTTFNSALAAFYNKIPIGHVEAGLRSNDLYSPFPEEANRKLTGAIANIHFAPTINNRLNLIREGITENIYVTGNTVIDALLSVKNEEYVFENNILNKVDFVNKKVILLTTHRRENWGDPMKNIFLAVKELIDSNQDIEVVFPMHKNPLIRELANNIFDGVSDRIHLVEQLGYVEFTNLMAKCYLIMTDSGGVQEEAPALGKPVVVLRTETERPEAVEAGTVKVVGINKENIYKVTNELVNNKSLYNKMADAINPYGVGDSSERIVNLVKEYLKSDLESNYKN